MHRTFLALGAVFGFLAVALGAFAAHGLKTRLSPEMLEIFETGARYQMYHALALILVTLITDRIGGRFASIAGWCFVAGILVFSGSLYLLAATGIKGFGAITPIGGVAFLAGWALLAAAALRKS